MLTAALLFILTASSFATANIVDGWDGPGPRRTQPAPVIRTPQGLLRGKIEFYDGFRSHISYKGIPYAQGQLEYEFNFFNIF